MIASATHLQASAFLDARVRPKLQMVNAMSPDGGSCGSDTRGLLKRMTVEGGIKFAARKEANRRWAEGNDPSLVEQDEDDATGKVFTRSEKQSYHRTRQTLATQMREWLKTLPLKRVGRDLQIETKTLRKGRDAKPVSRSTQKKLFVLFRMMQLGLSLNEALNAARTKGRAHSIKRGRYAIQKSRR